MTDWADLEARNAPLNAFVDWDHTATPGQGPLADLVIGIKSNIAVAGLPWTAGMGMRRNIIAERDAEVVERLRTAGAFIPGTLNMHEAALGATTDNFFYGRTHNPHRHDFTPGGSSGGSGAAVAVGLCEAALGTDTLGSVRIPAAYCGVWGLKPTLGAVSTDGLVPLGRDFDVIGPLAKDLPTLERVWNALKTLPLEGEAGWGCSEPVGPGAPSPSPSPPGREARLLALANLADVEVEPAVRDAYERTLAQLGTPTPITLPHSTTAIRMAALAIVARELIADLGEARHGDGISPDLRFILAALEQVPLAPHVLAETRDALIQALGDDGILIMPTAPQAAFAHGTYAPANQADFTCLASVAGLPALSIPAGIDKDGLPVGVQLVGPARSEAALFAFARTLGGDTS